MVPNHKSLQRNLGQNLHVGLRQNRNEAKSDWSPSTSCQLGNLCVHLYPNDLHGSMCMAWIFKFLFIVLDNPIIIIVFCKKKCDNHEAATLPPSFLSFANSVICDRPQHGSSTLAFPPWGQTDKESTLQSCSKSLSSKAKQTLARV